MLSKISVILLLIIFLLPACTPGRSPVVDPLEAFSPTVMESEPSAPASRPTTASEPAGEISTSIEDPAPTRPPSGTATPDTRLDPADWKNWPVTPTVSARAAEIYRRGQALGRDPGRFSVIGDCQSIREVFLGDYDDPRRYRLDAPYLSLQETVDAFHGSFDRLGMAVRGGFTAASLLSPLHADPQYCNSGESPLGCEVRLHNPSIVIVSLETWADHTTIERYEVYLRKILDAAIEQGVLPVLLTKADVAEVGDGKHYINPAIARLAYEYDLPLANFWRSAQNLPNWGIDPARDGFHLSEDGFRLKSFVALQALDAVRRQLEGEPAAGEAAALEPTPAPTGETALRFSPPSVCSSPGSACAVFGLSAAGAEDLSGVYFYNLDSQEVERFGPPGLRLWGAAPGGEELLVSLGPVLARVALDGQTTTITTHLDGSSTQPAAYEGSSLVYLEREHADQPGGLVHWIAGMEQPESIQTPVLPGRVIPTDGVSMLLWQARDCEGTGCPEPPLYATDLKTGESRPVEGVLQPSLSPDDQTWAFMDPQYTTENGFNDKLVVENMYAGLATRRLVIFPPAEGYMVRPRLQSYLWAPDGSGILAIMADHSNYFEKVLVYHTYHWAAGPGWLKEYDRLYGAMPVTAWAPAGGRVLIGITVDVDAGEAEEFHLQFKQIDLASGESVDTEPGLSLPEGAYAYLTGLYWLR